MSSDGSESKRSAPLSSAGGSRPRPDAAKPAGAGPVGGLLSWFLLCSLVIAVATSHLWVPQTDPKTPLPAAEQLFASGRDLSGAHEWLEANGERYSSSCEGANHLTGLARRLWEEADVVFMGLHFLNWFIAGLTIESSLLAFTCSITDELLEVWSADLNPTFRECWYDRILMDLLGANALGLLCAAAVVRWRGRTLPHFTSANFGLWSPFLLGLVHATVFHFGFMLKLALRMSASSPIFIMMSIAAFAMESAGHRAYLKTRLAIEPPSKMQVRDWPAAFWACLVGCGLMWCTLAMLDAKSTVIIAKRAVAVVALVTPAAAVVRSSVPFKQQH